MTKENIKLGLSCAAALFAFIAGVLWLFASLQNVKPTDKSRFSSEILISLPTINGEDSDILATSARQNYWNGWAALAASIAAMCQIPLAFM
jgi:hypothetical protein